MVELTCTWIERDEVFEGYVGDSLGPEDRDAFEEHFFGCETCFDKLRTYQAMQLELRAAAAELPAVQRAEAVRVRAWRWAGVPVAAGLLVVAAVAVWLTSRTPGVPESTVAGTPIAQPAAAPAVAPLPGPPVAASVPATPQSAQQIPAPGSAPTRAPAATPVVALSVLARVEPPLYIPLTLRGARDEAAEKFEAAMRRYEEGDYAGAIPELGAAAALNPKATHVSFFLAICNLLTDRLDAAVEGLQRTVALGDSPYLEEAHYYLAKARLRQGDVPAARQELVWAIERRGRLQADARRLLAQVDALGARR